MNGKSAFWPWSCKRRGEALNIIFFPCIASKYLLTFFVIRKFYSNLFFSLFQNELRFVCAQYTLPSALPTHYSSGFDRSFFSVRFSSSQPNSNLCVCVGFFNHKNHFMKLALLPWLVFSFMCHNSSYYAVTKTIKGIMENDAPFFRKLFLCASSQLRLVQQVLLDSKSDFRNPRLCFGPSMKYTTTKPTIKIFSKWDNMWNWIDDKHSEHSWKCREYRKWKWHHLIIHN